MQGGGGGCSREANVRHEGREIDSERIRRDRQQSGSEEADRRRGVYCGAVGGGVGLTAKGCQVEPVLNSTVTPTGENRNPSNGGRGPVSRSPPGSLRHKCNDLITPGEDALGHIRQRVLRCATMPKDRLL